MLDFLQGKKNGRHLGTRKTYLVIFKPSSSEIHKYSLAHLMFLSLLHPPPFQNSQWGPEEEEEDFPELHWVVIVARQGLIDAATWGSRLCGS